MTANQLKTVTIATILVVVTTAAGLLTACGGEREPDTRARSDSRSGVDLMARVDDYTARFRPGSGYQEPSRRDRDTVARGVRLLLDGDRTGARRALADIDFTVRALSDSATGRRYTEVADRSDAGPAPRGWGRIYLAQDSTPANDRWTVQVPHPVADRNTERLGVGVLRGTRGGIMVIAGAHREAGEGRAADVAHRTDTVFDAVCAALAERGLPAVQVHGFADSSAPGRDAVVSTGRGTVARPEGRLLADALHDRGFPVCRAWSASCPLEGRTNVQGRKAAEEHVAFLHIEFSNRIRTDEQRTAAAVAALGRVTNLWQKGERP
ncbi:hypothetical protein ACOKM5_11300 [Streptomyces sp. BH097]|uniref:hypothetical protein n=1 Tax=unclassified Streptomyces TaxID=2593676 RepID=UPI003BB6FA9A